MPKPALRVVEDPEPAFRESKPEVPTYSSVYGFEAVDRLMLTGGEILRGSYINRIKTALVTGSGISRDCVEFMMSEAEHQLAIEPDNIELRRAVEKGDEAVAAYLKDRLFPPGKGAKRRLDRETDK